MPRAKTLQNYDDSFFSLVKRAAREVVRIETSSESAAKNLRSELYVFRGVLRQNPNYSPTHTLAAEDIRFRIDGNVLIVEPRPLARSRLIAEVLQGDKHATDKATATG